MGVARTVVVKAPEGVGLEDRGVIAVDTGAEQGGDIDQEVLVEMALWGVP